MGLLSKLRANAKIMTSPVVYYYDLRLVVCNFFLLLVVCLGLLSLAVIDGSYCQYDPVLSDWNAWVNSIGLPSLPDTKPTYCDNPKHDYVYSAPLWTYQNVTCYRPSVDSVVTKGDGESLIYVGTILQEKMPPICQMTPTLSVGIKDHAALYVCENLAKTATVITNKYVAGAENTEVHATQVVQFTDASGRRLVRDIRTWVQASNGTIFDKGKAKSFKWKLEDLLKLGGMKDGLETKITEVQADGEVGTLYARTMGVVVSLRIRYSNMGLFSLFKFPNAEPEALIKVEAVPAWNRVTTALGSNGNAVDLYGVTIKYEDDGHSIGYITLGRVIRVLVELTVAFGIAHGIVAQIAIYCCGETSKVFREATLWSAVESHAMLTFIRSKLPPQYRYPHAREEVVDYSKIKGMQTGFGEGEDIEELIIAGIDSVTGMKKKRSRPSRGLEDLRRSCTITAVVPTTGVPDKREVQSWGRG